MTSLTYALVLAVAGLLLITFRRRIAEFRNRGAGDTRWGVATPRRYLMFGILFLILAILRVVT